MEVQSDLVDPATPALSNNNASLWRTEDSGYHTTTSSLTPGSVDCSELCNENLDPAFIQRKIHISAQFQVNYDVTPDSNFGLANKYVRAKNILSSTQTASSPGSPAIRRGVKRPYHDHTENTPQNSAPTPTSAIAGGIQKLKVTENNQSPTNWSSHMYYASSSGDSRHSETVSSSTFYHLSEYTHHLSYPTTPVKKICRTSCKLSPMRRSNKKLSFAVHSLSCESSGVVKRRPHHKVVRTIQFRPDQKIDIIKMLYQDAGVLPPVMKILNYLSHKDICSFILVSPLWCQAWNQVSEAKKLEFEVFLKNEKDNQENKDKGLTRKNSDANQDRSLKEVHNVMNTTAIASSTPNSPPGTPRTNKFKKYTKCAQSDPRLQLSCVRCNQPSKVTKEPSGEEWAECTSITCSYCFCKYCKCERHPGKNCIKYDLDGPSPSKRKRNNISACTRKSKKNLYRLMI